jgi:hypothetical protein
MSHKRAEDWLDSARKDAMSRASRIPFLQNIYDLFGIQPGELPSAARKIAAHEARHVSLPASVREYYLHEHAFPRAHSSSPDLVVPLTGFLEQIESAEWGEGGRRWAHIMFGEYYGRRLIYLDESDDPVVWADQRHTNDPAEWEREGNFSDVLYSCLNFFCKDGSVANPRGRFWLRSPDEPFQPPVIDFLTDQFGEPLRIPRPGDVTTYTFRPGRPYARFASSTIRVTADEPALTGGLSAWWLQARTGECLVEFARLLFTWGTLRSTLIPNPAAHEMIEALRSESPTP